MNPFHAEGARAVAEALQVNQTVVQIALNGGYSCAGSVRVRQRTELARARVVNRMGAEGVRALAEALKVNQTLMQIDLGCKSRRSGGGEGVSEEGMTRCVQSFDLVPRARGSWRRR